MDRIFREPTEWAGDDWYEICVPKEEYDAAKSMFYAIYGDSLND